MINMIAKCAQLWQHSCRLVGSRVEIRQRTEDSLSSLATDDAKKYSDRTVGASAVVA